MSTFQTFWYREKKKLDSSHQINFSSRKRVNVRCINSSKPLSLKLNIILKEET